MQTLTQKLETLRAYQAEILAELARLPYGSQQHTDRRHEAEVNADVIVSLMDAIEAE